MTETTDRKAELIRLSQAGDQQAADALWAEFELIVDQNGHWTAENYTALLRTLAEHKP